MLCGCTQIAGDAISRFNFITRHGRSQATRVMRFFAVILHRKINGITNMVYKKACFQHKKYTKIWTYHAVVSLRTGMVCRYDIILLRRSYAVLYMIRVIA